MKESKTISAIDPLFFKLQVAAGYELNLDGLSMLNNMMLERKKIALKLLESDIPKETEYLKMSFDYINNDINKVLGL